MVSLVGDVSHWKWVELVESDLKDNKKQVRLGSVRFGLPNLKRIRQSIYQSSYFIKHNQNILFDWFFLCNFGQVSVKVRLGQFEGMVGVKLGIRLFTKISWFVLRCLTKGHYSKQTRQSTRQESPRDTESQYCVSAKLLRIRKQVVSQQLQSRTLLNQL